MRAYGRFWMLLLMAPLSAAEEKPPRAPAKPPVYKLSAGPHEVAVHKTLVLRDEKRDKDLQVRITYPKEKGRYPILVHSHGARGSKDAYEPLVRHWVSHGYVCIQPTHSESLSLGAKADRRIAQAWKRRPGDVSFVLDSLAEIEKRVPGLAGKLDGSRIGAGGHSYGAHTAQLIGGVRTHSVPGATETFRDERVKCVLLLSPQGRGAILKQDSWKTLKAPAMVVTGSKDSSPRTGQGPEWRLDVYNFCPPGDKYLVYIDGAYHGFGGITGRVWRGSGPANEDHVNIVKTTGLAFYDAYVKGDAKAKAWLASEAPGRAFESKIRYERK